MAGKTLERETLDTYFVSCNNFTICTRHMRDTNGCPIITANGYLGVEVSLWGTREERNRKLKEAIARTRKGAPCSQMANHEWKITNPETGEGLSIPGTQVLFEPHILS